MSVVELEHQVPLLQQNPRNNDCGPYAAAMALGYYNREACDPALVAREIRLLRLPLIGATLPWGIALAIGRHKLRAYGGWFSRLDSVKQHVAADRPVIVLVKPTDLPVCPWYALHYRLVVGFRDDPSLPGGGVLYFNCSATPPRVHADLPGNLAVDYATFQRQWRTYLTFNWSVAVGPGV